MIKPNLFAQSWNMQLTVFKHKSFKLCFGRNYVKKANGFENYQ